MGQFQPQRRFGIVLGDRFAVKLSGYSGTSMRTSSRPRSASSIAGLEALRNEGVKRG